MDSVNSHKYRTQHKASNLKAFYCRKYTYLKIF